MPFLIPITSLLRLKVTSIILILRWKLRMANTPLRLKLLMKNYHLLKPTSIKKKVALSHSKKKSRIRWISVNKGKLKLTTLDNQSK